MYLRYRPVTPVSVSLAVSDLGLHAAPAAAAAAAALASAECLLSATHKKMFMFIIAFVFRR
jgi:hypothetical protein